MDQRLQHILDHYEEMCIGVDESFRFRCDQCGKCCINREDILLNPKDLYNISKELGLKPEETVEKYCERYIGHDSRLPIVRLRPRGSIKRCPLLKDRRCSVHKAKPVVCAMYPIGRCIKMERDQCTPEQIGEVEIQYILNPIDCGDRTETHTVREWLEEFSLPVRDESFIQWQKTISAVGAKIRQFEPVYSDRNMEMVWSIIYAVLYLNYDTERDYDEQFQVNSEKLIDILEQLPLPSGGHDHE